MSDPDKAKILSRFFRTGRGEYGEGDRFLGVAVPDIRKTVKSYRDAARKEVLKLLRSAYHEERLAALLILVEQYRRGDASRKRSIYNLYLSNTGCINNWDLVDLTAPHIVGAHLFGKSTSVLTELALSEYLWERRIAMLSTHQFWNKMAIPGERIKSWLPLAGGMALLGILGSGGGRVDLMAHLFGYLSGMALETAHRFVVKRRPGQKVQIACLIILICVICACWYSGGK